MASDPAEPGARPPSPDAARDLGLIRDALGGRSDAVATLLERLKCVPRIVYAINGKLGRPLRPEECEDVVQEALLAVWKKLERYDGRARLETWVYPFCYYETLRRLRGRRRDPVLLEESIEGSGMEPVSGPAPDQEDHERVLKELDSLDAEMADVIRLKLFEDLTFEQVGERLGMSPNTAKSRYYRGVRKLDRRMRQTTGHRADGAAS